LPGPPRECEMMFRHRAGPYLKKLSDGVIASRTVKTFGIGESSVEDQLRDLMNALHNPTLAPYAKPTGTELRITAHAQTEEEAFALIAPVEEQVKAILGDYVIGVDVNSVQEVCFNLLREKGLTLGTAESCTGGLIAKLMTDLPGSSQVFNGGIVSYTNGVKAGVLGVSQDLLDEYGAVSAQVAEAMARGAKAVLGCDVAVSATGVAGPDSDDRGNPVGLVYLGLAYGDQCIVQEFHAGRGDRDRVRRMAAGTALDMVRRHLTDLL
ncbi:MAG: nicotinamide-nucleotide amidohydrolase family protein, partial [Ruminiclostridium sp.]|nr:nicotinamide-nucleotide amidohydrolase family protein [Ruminiclostridium sp.]